MATPKRILVIGSSNMDLSMNVYKVPEAGETVTQKYSEAAEVASQNKIKKLVTYFK